jgi:DNA-binding LacI/PurR family transcriptional regulator
VRARAGALEAIAARGLAGAFSPADGNPAGVAEAIEDLFGQNPALSALIVYNEQALPLVLDRLTQLGRHIPGDMSVVAICPDDQAEHLVPAVSDVALPAAELGRLAFERLAGLIAGHDQPLSTLLEPHLVRRGSGGPPPRQT